MAQLPVKKQLVFFSQLASLYKAGLSIGQGLGHLREQIDDRQLLEVIGVLEDYILRRNQPLTDALRSIAGKFPPLVLALVEQGEVSGKLDTTFARIVEILDKRRKRILEVYKALAYPLFLACVAALLIPIPKAFQSGSVKVYFQQLALPIGVVVGFWLLVKFIRSSIQTNASIRYRLHRTMLGLPKIGLLVRKLVLGRFASSLALMLNVGLSADRAVAIAARATENDYVVLAVGPSIDSIREGHTLAESLRLCPVFPPSFAGMLATGEATGEASAQLERLAAMYESEADTVIQMLVGALGPLVLALVSGLVALQVIQFYMQQFEGLEKLYRSL
ncbi:MAG: type II secretion system F family protein [Candidatus Wallbacteria bacterium]|nr:type II secretion system F family protein [Candidatus Wallbacteria bacterium]